MCFREFLGIIEGYISGLFTERLLIENDSLIAINSLTSQSDDISDLGALAYDFLDRTNRSSTSFSRIKKEGNIPTHFLVGSTLDSNVFLE